MTAAGGVMFREVLDAIARLTERVRRIESAATTGTVNDAGPPIQIRFDGDTVDVPVTLHLAGYIPADDDRVLLVRVGGAWIILGAI